MAASDHLGRQWKQPELTFEAHRGLSQISRSNVDKNWVGQHWSADMQVARIFAEHPLAGKGHYGMTSNGPDTIVHAQIPLSSVETRTKKLLKMGVQLHNPESEEEVTAKRKSKVFVTGLTSVRSTPFGRKERKRTYNPPREMKA